MSGSSKDRFLKHAYQRKQGIEVKHGREGMWLMMKEIDGREVFYALSRWELTETEELKYKE